jgi:two-component system phosphate regulon response regulator PhoB
VIPAIFAQHSGRRARRRALIVEDHDDTRDLLAWCLRAGGWQVDTARNGLEAVVAAETYELDVIVMDLHLPMIDGFETTRRLRSNERTSGVPIVVCTAYGREHQAEIDQTGFAAVIPKPCTPEELRLVVETLARRSPDRTTPGSCNQVSGR